MSDGACKFCDGPVEAGVGMNPDTCDPCWYGMRLEPERWERDMEKRGRSPIFVGGRVEYVNDEGVVASGQRSPYAPGLRLVKTGDGDEATEEAKR